MANRGTARRGPQAWFGEMIDHALAYAEAAHAAGRPIVGILCEYTPRELVMAAGAVPVCLCGGDADTIPAAEAELPTNLCPLIKSTYGYSVRRENPFLEMASLVVGETTCDGKKKMLELLARSRPVYVLELPQKPEAPEALAHWQSELRAFAGELEARFGTQITSRRLREAIAQMNRERALRRDLAELMRADPPPLTGRELLDLKSIISALPADLGEYERAVTWFRRRRPPAGLGDRVRVLLTGVPLVHGAERVLELIESHGGLVVCQENCTGIKPILEDVDESAPDPWHALAAKYLHLPCSVMAPNRRRFDTLRRLVAEYRPACMVELVWHACLTYDVESVQVRALADDLHLPYLKITTDYAPSDSARLTVRLEALFETVRGRCGRRLATGRCRRPSGEGAAR